MFESQIANFSKTLLVSWAKYNIYTCHNEGPYFCILIEPRLESIAFFNDIFSVHEEKFMCTVCKSVD